MPPSDLAPHLEARLLHPGARLDDVLAAADRAAEAGLASVIAAPIYTRDLTARLETAASPAGPPPLPGAVAAHPVGAVPPMMRSIAATQVAKAGARLIETAAWRPAILESLEDLLYEDLLMLARSVRSVRGSIRLHVAIDVPALRDTLTDPGDLAHRLRFASAAIRETGCDAIVTGVGDSPATPEDVAALRAAADDFPIKAAGLIRDRAAALALLEAGADFLSCDDFEAVLNPAS